MKFDEKNMGLLEELQKDCKQPVRVLSNKLKLSNTAIQHRIRKLEQEGVIKKYSAVIDCEKIGLPTTAFVFVTTRNVQIDKDKKVRAKDVMDDLSKSPEIQEAYGVSGDCDILIKVKGKNERELGQRVTEIMKDHIGVEKTTTCFALYVAKESLDAPFALCKN